MRKINKIKLFSNHTERSDSILDELVGLIKLYDFELVDEGFDLAIAIGGDGAFLRMVKDTNFDSSVYYIGINTGTLGFLQEIRPNNLRSFIEALNNDDFKVDNIGVLETKVSTDDSISRYYALNEVFVN